jgi:plasmid stability protein
MASLTIKGIPDDLYEQLRQSATQHRRSMNSEVIVCLQQALRNSQIDTEAFLARARIYRRRTHKVVLTDRVLAKAKNEGRP